MFSQFLLFMSYDDGTGEAVKEVNSHFSLPPLCQAQRQVLYSTVT